MIKHGTPGGFTDGCREICCRRAKKADRAERSRREAAGHVYTTSPEAPLRKLRALAALGHPHAFVARRLGVSQQALSATMHRARIRTSTAERIDAAYAALEMVIPPDDRYTRRTRNRALSLGWKPPLAWEDIDAGVLAEVPVRENLLDRLDLDVVDHVLYTRDFSVQTSPLEKAEIMRRWLDWGRSEKSLCDLAGWRPGRYSPKTPAENGEPS